MLKYLHDEDSEISKILFTGLDNAGKSSIILTLRREFAEIGSISPTLGSQKRVFDFLGKRISEWDLGGQQKYRISYLKRPNDYFKNTSIGIYVIDIQDQERFEESTEYLKKVVQKFEDLELKPFIHIFFHKYDPLLIENHEDEYQIRVDDLKQIISQKISYKHLDFHQTSIFDISSIIKAISHIFLSFVPKTILIDKTLEEFVNKSNSKGILIVDDNSLLISSYFESDVIENLAMESIPYFLTLNDSFENTNVDSLNNPNTPYKTTVVKKSENYFIFSKIRLKEQTSPYYILIIKENSAYKSQNIKSIENVLGEILQ